MHIQGRKLKGNKKPQKGVLNEFADSRIITFTEQEIGDVIEVEYQIGEDEKGYFSEEYRPDTVAREDAKVIDITAFIINEKESKCYWWLYDLKKDVGGQDVILHLCQQWQAAYRYLNNSVLSYLSDASIETRGKIGVITRNFDTDRIQTEFELLNEEIKEMEGDPEQRLILAKRKAGVRLPALRVKRDLLKDILNQKVCFRCAGKDMEFVFDVKISTERSSGEYYYHLVCNHTLC